MIIEESRGDAVSTTTDASTEVVYTLEAHGFDSVTLPHTNNININNEIVKMKDKLDGIFVELKKLRQENEDLQKQVKRLEFLVEVLKD